jgi:hypothetical protein
MQLYNLGERVIRYKNAKKEWIEIKPKRISEVEETLATRLMTLYPKELTEWGTKLPEDKKEVVIKEVIVEKVREMTLDEMRAKIAEVDSSKNEEESLSSDGQDDTYEEGYKKKKKK